LKREGERGKKKKTDKLRVKEERKITVKTENGYQAALRPRLPPRAAPRLVHQDLWPIRTNVGGFFFGFEVGIPDL
jgi:hypothetical protein